MDREKEIKEVLYGYLEAGLVEGCCKRVLTYLTDDIMGYGMGEQGFVHSKEDIERIMSTTKKTDGVQYYLEYENIHIHFQSDSTASVCATVYVVHKAGDVTSKSGLMQSLTLRREEGRWLICALHASPVMLSEESIHAYPLKYADHTLEHLKTELQQETLDLMNRSFSGGLISCRNDGRGVYPLSFINDSMLSILNYTRPEFVRQFGSNALPVVHPNDRERFVEELTNALSKGRDYEIQHRMMRKGGEIRWMIVRGRRSIDENGNEILLGVFTDVTEMVAMQDTLKRQAKELAVNEERFRIALENTTNMVFDYHIANGDILHLSTASSVAPYITKVEHIQDYLINGGSIAEESLEECKGAFCKIKEAPQADCVIRVGFPENGISWYRITLTGIPDSSGKNQRAIGVIEDITRQKEAELAYGREEQYRKAILSDALASYIVNFTRDIVESCTVNSPYCLDPGPGSFYEASIQEMSYLRLNHQTQIAHLNLFSRAQVLQRFSEGERELMLEYPVINADGTDMWMRTTLHLIEDSVTGDVIGFMYVTDIDKKKREELELKRKAEQDSMTGLFNKKAFTARLEDKLHSWESLQSGVFFIIDIDYFKGINDRFGHPFGDEVLKCVADILLGSFREGDLTGRLGGDEFCVFFCGVRSEKRIAATAAQLCRQIREISAVLFKDATISCSIGISVCAGIRKSFDRLYREADLALYHVKRNGRDGYSIYNRDMNGE